MNTWETNPPIAKPFPIVSLLVAIGVAVGLVFVLGCLVVCVGVLGQRQPSAGPLTTVAATPPASDADRIVGTWRTEGRMNKQPCTYRFTFGPGPACDFTYECTLSNGTVLPTAHGTYSYSNGELLWTLSDTFGYSDETITWLDNNRCVSKVLNDGNPSLMGQQFTFTRVR